MSEFYCKYCGGYHELSCPLHASENTTQAYALKDKESGEIYSESGTSVYLDEHDADEAVMLEKTFNDADYEVVKVNIQEVEG